MNYILTATDFAVVGTHRLERVPTLPIRVYKKWYVIRSLALCAYYATIAIDFDWVSFLLTFSIAVRASLLHLAIGEGVERVALEL